MNESNTSSITPVPITPSIITTELWEKQTYESAKAFSAFKVYRDLHPSVRSLRKAVQSLYGSSLPSKVRQWGKWSSKFNWVIRASAWDEERDKQERLAQINQVTEANKRHLAVAKSLQAIAIEKLKTVKPEDISSLEQMLRIIEQSYHMEREILGMNDITITETEIEQEEITVLSDLTNLTTQELRKRLAQRRLHVSNNGSSTDHL